MGTSAKSYVQCGLESNYTMGGSLPTAVAAKKLIPVTESKFELKKEWDKPNEQRNSYAMYFENLQALGRIVEWNIKGLWYPDTCLGLMTMVTGNAPTITQTTAAAPEPAYYTWNFLAQDSLKSATFEEHDGTQQWQIANCFAEKLEIDFSAEKEMTYTLSGFGLDKTQHTMTAALTQPTELPHIGMSAKVWIDDLGTTPGTTQYMDLMSGKITIELNTKPIRTAQNSGTYARMYRGKRMVTLDLDVDYTSTTDSTEFQTKYAGAVYRIIKIEFEGPLLPGGSGGAVKNYYTNIVVPVRYESFVTDKSKEHTTAKIKGISAYDATLGYDYQVNAQVASTSSALANY